MLIYVYSNNVYLFIKMVVHSNIYYVLNDALPILERSHRTPDYRTYKLIVGHFEKNIGLRHLFGPR